MFGFNYNPPVISSIRLENLEVSAKNAASTAIEIRNDVQALHDTVLQYRNESEFYFTQVQQIQEGDYVTTQSLSDTLGAFGFDDLANVPAAFVPVAHSHLWADITDKPAEFKPAAHLHKWADIMDKPVEFEPAEHIHTWQQIAEKPGTFPPESHFHSWEEIENKPARFNPVAHQHSWADITGKPSAYAPSAHNHEWSEIQNKPELLALGDYGVGSKAAPDSIVNSNTAEGGFFRADDRAESAMYGQQVTLTRAPYTVGRSTQIAMSITSKQIWWSTQVSANQWTNLELLHDGNLIFARNVSGALVGPNGGISGSNLSPAQLGTWRNVGRIAENNEFSLWRVV